jgi:hypothetical protein
LLHVIEASHGQAREQARAVFDTLQKLTLANAHSHRPQQGGPIHRSTERRLCTSEMPDTIAISALTAMA